MHARMLPEGHAHLHLIAPETSRRPWRRCWKSFNTAGFGYVGQLPHPWRLLAV